MLFHTRLVQGHHFGSSRWRYKTSKFTSCFLGAIWLLEAVSAFLETAPKPLGTRELLGPRKMCVSSIDRAVNRNASDFLIVKMNSPTSYVQTNGWMDGCEIALNRNGAGLTVDGLARKRCLPSSFFIITFLKLY